MNEVFVIALSPLVVLVVLLVAKFLPDWRIKQLHQQIRQKSTAELKAICSGEPNIFLLGPALQELKTRGEDISFVFPTLIDMALHWNVTRYVPARGLLKTYFQDKLPQIDFSQPQLSKEHLQKLEEIRKQIQKLNHVD